MSDMVELYIDEDNEFYVIDNGSHERQIVVNLVTDSETYITQAEFIDLRKKMRHYTVARERALDLIDSARTTKALSGYPSYYKQSYWDSYHGDT